MILVDSKFLNLPQFQKQLTMGIFTDTIKTFELLAATIALLSVHDLSGVNYTPTHQKTLQCGFTQDFINFLNSNNYTEFDFTRPDVKCGSFGGKSNDDLQIDMIPIVFVHGSSDIGFGRGSADGYLPWQTGFRSLATYFTQNGWQKSELYTVTWGQVDPTRSHQNYHSKKILLYIRAFIKAVLEYTSAKQIILISHSMGVSLARKVIKGGKATDHIEGQYDLGHNLTSKVKAFIGLGGANLGIVGCYDKLSYLTCNEIDGLFPGYLPNSGPSNFLTQLNKNPALEGQEVYSIWSKFDDLIGYEGLVWGKHTSRIPSQAEQIVKDSPQWSHYHLRDNTAPEILEWIKK